MGNESSVEMAQKGVKLQEQGEEHLWTLCLERGPEGEGEGACVFSRRPGKGSLADLCKAAVEHLRLIRHPNIIKFLGSDLSHDCILLYTEPLIPVLSTLEAGPNTESVVMGWRGVASGLRFLHEKACLSHNNMHAGCVYVNVLDSQWKVGGFESASRQKDINNTFLSAISSIRHEKATPPEDKVEGKVLSAQPTHCRDVWAFGQFILTILEEADLEVQFDESLFQYVSDEMLNPDPQLRPTMSEILAQPWMSNKCSVITDFLSNLTLKTKTEKDHFFRGLAGDLFSLAPVVLAEHMVPLLLTPLVMAEPVAAEALWQHLLLPRSSQHPQGKVFEASQPCPLLQEDLFKSHVLPVLLNLLESRDQHVRLTLLRHLGGFAGLCQEEELVGVVLPEVLVGLKDSSELVVGATLHALGDLVPLMGAHVVMGTSRKHVFTDAQPRTASPEVGVPCERQGTVQLKTSPPHSARKNTPPLPRPVPAVGRSREERMREMKEKREQQRLKRLTQNKLGHVTTSSAVGPEAHSEAVAPPPLPSPQYSPSISHDDDVEGEGLGGSGTSVEGAFRGSKLAASDGSEAEEELGEEWEELEEAEAGGSQDDWGGAWSDVNDTGEEEEQVSETTRPHLPYHSSNDPSSEPTKGGVVSQQRVPPSGMSLKGKLRHGGDAHGKGSPGDSAPSKLLKGRLKEEDIQRLEEQAKLNQHEPDLFADMAPKISASSGSSLFLSSPGTSGGVASSSKSTTPTAATISNSFQYQAEHQEGPSGGWDSEDWNDI